MWKFMAPSSTRRCISSSTTTRDFGWWDHVKPAPLDPINGVTKAFHTDPSPNKINLGVVLFPDINSPPLCMF